MGRDNPQVRQLLLQRRFATDDAGAVIEIDRCELLHAAKTGNVSRETCAGLERQRRVKK